MPDINIRTDYIPIETVILPNDGEKLEFYFNTFLTPELTQSCQSRILLPCGSEGIKGLTGLRLFWHPECGNVNVIEGNTGDSKLEYTPDGDDIVTEIKVTIDAAILSNKNYFQLFATVTTDSVSLTTLFSRGVIYTEVPMGSIVDL